MRHANIAIFIPFGGCPQICSYCNQKTIADTVRQPTPEEVHNEVQSAISKLDTTKFRAEIAFFGGSFTALERDYMCAILESVQPCLENPAVTGIRISTRPDAIDSYILNILKYYHVTAIELGAQSMDDHVLALNRRGHTAADVENASRIIHEAGIELGLQMMTGLYGEQGDSALITAERLIDLSPATVRIYPTLVLKGTHLAELLENGLYRPQTLDEAVTLGALLLERFEKAGITVIRLGLHDGVSLKKDLVAGPYHPAFRSLCESERFYRRLSEKLDLLPIGKQLVEVNPSTISIAVGNRRCNVERLENKGIKVKFKANPEIPRGAFEIK